MSETKGPRPVVKYMPNLYWNACVHVLYVHMHIHAVYDLVVMFTCSMGVYVSVA